MKGGFTTFYKQMAAEYDRLQKLITSLQTQRITFPDGKLICTRNGTHYKWYHSNGHTSSYIPKKDRKLAEKLAFKKYLSLRLEEAMKELLISPEPTSQASFSQSNKQAQAPNW